MRKMTARRITLLTATFVAVVAYVVPENVETVKAFLSLNTTNIREVTRLPVTVLLPIGVALIGIFVYLWIDAGEEDSVSKLGESIDLLNKNIVDMRIELSGKLDALAEQIARMGSDDADKK